MHIHITFKRFITLFFIISILTSCNKSGILNIDLENNSESGFEANLFHIINVDITFENKINYRQIVSADFISLYGKDLFTEVNLITLNGVTLDRLYQGQYCLGSDSSEDPSKEPFLLNWKVTNFAGTNFEYKSKQAAPIQLTNICYFDSIYIDKGYELNYYCPIGDSLNLTFTYLPFETSLLFPNDTVTQEYYCLTKTFPNTGRIYLTKYELSTFPSHSVFLIELSHNCTEIKYFNDKKVKFNSVYRIEFKRLLL